VQLSGQEKEGLLSYVRSPLFRVESRRFPGKKPGIEFNGKLSYSGTSFLTDAAGQRRLN